MKGQILSSHQYARDTRHPSPETRGVDSLAARAYSVAQTVSSEYGFKSRINYDDLAKPYPASSNREDNLVCKGCSDEHDVSLRELSKVGKINI